MYAVIECTNTYPVNANGVLKIKKQVTKDYERDVVPGDTFTFTVRPTDGNVLSGEYTVKIATDTPLAPATTTIEVTAENNELIIDVPFEDDELRDLGLNDSRTKILTITGLPLGRYSIQETAESGDENYIRNTNNALRTVNVTTSSVETVFINEYRRHLGTLTITKNLKDGVNDGQEFLFHITGNGVDMDVTITGSGSVKIYDLPLGSYTVTEDTSWSWRYTQTSSNTADNTITLDDLHANVTFRNEYRINQWLNYFTNELNIFSK